MAEDLESLNQCGPCRRAYRCALKLVIPDCSRTPSSLRSRERRCSGSGEMLASKSADCGIWGSSFVRFPCASAKSLQSRSRSSFRARKPVTSERCRDLEDRRFHRGLSPPRSRRSGGYSRSRSPLRSLSSTSLRLYLTSKGISWRRTSARMSTSRLLRPRQ